MHCLEARLRLSPSHSPSSSPWLIPARNVKWLISFQPLSATGRLFGIIIIDFAWHAADFLAHTSCQFSVYGSFEWTPINFAATHCCSPAGGGLEWAVSGACEWGIKLGGPTKAAISTVTGITRTRGAGGWGGIWKEVAERGVHGPLKWRGQKSRLKVARGDIVRWRY